MGDQIEGQIELLDYLNSLNNQSELYKIKKPIRAISLFSGIGAQIAALRRLNYPVEDYKTSEWDINAIRMYQAMHTQDYTDYSEGMTVEQLVDWLDTKGVSLDGKSPLQKDKIKRKGECWLRETYNNYIATHNIGSIVNAHGQDLEIKDTDKYEYLMFYSFPCVTAGTLIFTSEGYKPIEEIKVGDMVLTHNNRFRKVLRTMSRTSDHINKITATGISDLFITDEHPLYILREGKEQWIKVKDLKDKDLLSYNNGNIKTDLCHAEDNILWLLGRYVADGHINKYSYNSVNFAIGDVKEKEFLEHMPEEFNGKFKKFKKPGIWDYRIADYEFQEACSEFGIGATNKEIPTWIFYLPKDKKAIFLNGYFSGDGHIRKERQQTLFCTVSHKLFLGLQKLIIDVYGSVCGCYIRKDSRKETFKDTYNGQFTMDLKSHNGQYIIDNKIFVPIRKVERFEKEIQVFNIEVEEDNSYTCGNIIVHNCQDLSVAGKQAGMSKDGNTRSGLLWHVERLLKECDEKPQILIMENVSQVHGKKFLDDWNKWLNALDNLGYKTFWADLNAKDFGIAQNRLRTFAVSFLDKNADYKFPEPFELTKCMKDYLEDQVDEKYYINNEKARKLIQSLIDRKELP